MSASANDAIGDQPKARSKSRGVAAGALPAGTNVIRRMYALDGNCTEVWGWRFRGAAYHSTCLLHILRDEGWDEGEPDSVKSTSKAINWYLHAQPGGEQWKADKQMAVARIGVKMLRTRQPEIPERVAFDHDGSSIVRNGGIVTDYCALCLHPRLCGCLHSANYAFCEQMF